MGRRILSVVLTLALAGAGLGVDPAGATPAESDRFFGPRLWVMHDSIMYAASDELRAELPYHQANFSGWPGYTVGVAPGLVRHERHLIDNIAVVSLGTNYLRDVAEFRRGVRDTLDALAGVKRVVWITPQLYRADINDVIDVLEDEARRRTNLELLDWTSVVADNPGLTRPGDVHLSPAGEQVYARLIADAVIERTSYDFAPVGRSKIRARRAGVVIQGWATDPDHGTPADVLVRVDGTTVAELTSRDRPGYRTRLALADGTHEICVIALDPGEGRDRDLGCHLATTANDPVGTIGALSRTGNELTVNGWALDPDGPRPIDVAVLVDGAVIESVTADRLRLDVEAAFDNGRRHGYRVGLAVGPGPHEVCIEATNIWAGADRRVDCRSVA